MAADIRDVENKRDASFGNRSILFQHLVALRVSHSCKTLSPQMSASNGCRDMDLAQSQQKTPSRPACRQCRARRVRCDRVAVSCGPCTRLELDCSFSSPLSASHQPGSNNLEDRDHGIASPEFTQAGTKRRRVRYACESCRAVKAKCSGGDICTRCRARGIRCTQRSVSDIQSRALPSDSGERNVSLLTPITASEAAGAPASSPILDDSERHLIRAYFDQTDPTTCVFLHAPSILSDWSNGKVEPALLKAICASGLRLQDPSAETQRLASARMSQVQDSLLGRLDSLSFPRLQALVLVISFQLEVGNTTQAWNLLGLAARLAFTLRLNHERPDLTHVVRESRRRTMWVIYAYDRRFCGGLEDLTVCPIERMTNIRLPCEDRTFERGMPSLAQYLSHKDSAEGTCDMDIVAYLLRLYATRDRILRYTKRVRREGISPAASKDELRSLENELGAFKGSLPADLQLDADRLALMAHSRDASGYFMLHTVWLQGYCDLYRFLVPGIREAVSREVIDATPSDYVYYCQRQCLDRAVQMGNMWYRISHMRRKSSIDDTFFGVCIFQVSQILYHLDHMLDQIPEGLDKLKSKLSGALQMASSGLWGRSSRMGDCLREAERLIGRLGQPRSPNPDQATRRSSRDYAHDHMVSRGSLLPRELPESEGLNSQSVDDELQEQTTQRRSGAAQNRQTQSLQNYTGHQNTNVSGSVFDNFELVFDGGRGGLMPWDPFDVQANIYYDPELGALGFQ